MPVDRSAAVPVLVVRVTLSGVRPPNFRDLFLPPTTTFLDLPAAIPHEANVRVASVLTRVGASVRDEYDFGDPWVHEVAVREVRPTSPSVGRPRMRCLGGARACPPDDCGGAPGYDDLLAALADPAHERHEGLTDGLTGWRAELASVDRRFRGPFEPEALDLAAADRAVSPLVLGAGLPEPD